VGLAVGVADVGGVAVGVADAVGVAVGVAGFKVERQKVDPVFVYQSSYSSRPSGECCQLGRPPEMPDLFFRCQILIK